MNDLKTKLELLVKQRAASLHYKPEADRLALEIQVTAAALQAVAMANMVRK